MKKFLKKSCVLLVNMMLFHTCLQPVMAANYQDVPYDDWRAEAINYVTEQGIMSGVGNNCFAPEDSVTREQIVALLYRLDGSPDVQYNGQFGDVQPDGWSAKAIAWACQRGIVNGSSVDKFSPQSNVTREQLAVMIEKYIGEKGELLPTTLSPIKGLKDLWCASEFAQDAIRFVWAKGIMNVDNESNFNPKNPVSRTDAAVTLMRTKQILSGETIVLPEWTVPDYSNMTQQQKEEQALEIAKRIAAGIPDNISDLDRVAMATSAVSHYCSYCTYTTEGKDYATAFGVFIKGEFSCAGATRALGMVLTCLGYDWKHVNENQYTHQWCELYMDGQIGFADAQILAVGYGKHMIERE